MSTTPAAAASARELGPLLPAEHADGGLTFAAFRAANVARCLKWHPQGIESWSPSDWLTAVTGELGELASLLKMRNRERDGVPGNKFSPTQKHIADEVADVLTYLDLLAAALGVDLGGAAVEKFNEVSVRVGFPDRIEIGPRIPSPDEARTAPAEPPAGVVERLRGLRTEMKEHASLLSEEAKTLRSKRAFNSRTGQAGELTMYARKLDAIIRALTPKERPDAE